MVIDGTIQGLLEDACSWLIGVYGQMDRKASERVREAMTQHLGDRISLLRILLSEEDEHARSPIMVRGHLRIEAQGLTAWTKQGSGIGQAGIGRIKQRTHDLFIETAIQLKSGNKCGHRSLLFSTKLSPGPGFQGDREDSPRGINLQTSPSTFVGAREDDVGLGGPLGSPASCSSGFHLAGTRPHPTPRATLKALPTPHHPLSPLRMLMGLVFG